VVAVSRRAAPRLPDPAALERTWLAAYPPGVPPTYTVPAVALTRFLDDAARDFPDRAAMVVDGRTTTFVEQRERVDRVATAFADAGIAAGDRVLVALPLGEPVPTVLYALWRLGAVAVPVDPATRPDRLAAVALDAELSAAIGAGDALTGLEAHDAAPPLRITARGDEWAPTRLRDRVRPRLARRLRRRSAVDAPAHRGWSTLGDLLADARPRTAPDPPPPDAAAVLAYRPRARDLRGVVLSHANLVANAFQGRLWVPDMQAGRERILVVDRLHLTLPLTLGLLTATLAAATLIVVPDPDGATLTRAIDRERPTLWPTGPDRLAQLLEPSDRRRDLTSLRAVVTGGAPVDAQVAAEVERRTGGARVREGYGLAEASPLTHAQPVYGRVQPGSVGVPVTGTVAVVVDTADLSTPVPVGEIGMLLVHGPQVASGYWRRPAATAATFRDGWLVTGDLATVDRGGVFTLLGRAGEVLRRDGELVAPSAVEAVLVRHPAVVGAAVVGPITEIGTGDASGDRAGADAGDGDGDGTVDREPRPPLVAAVVTRRRSRVDAAALLVHCRAHLPAAAVPDRIELVSDLPETPVGDPDRDALRRQLLGR
jgi:long-chain acyl-CoA synthetase